MSSSHRLLLRDCGCVTGVGMQFSPDLDVVIEDGVIVELGPEVCRGEGIALPGTVLVPGLINCHTHLGDAAFSGRPFGIPGQDLLWPPDGLRHRWMTEATPDVVIEGMRAAVEVMLASGTVAFADFREQGLAGVQALRRATEGMRIETIVFGRHASFPLHTEEQLVENVAELSPSQLAEIASVLQMADGFSPLWANDTTDVGLRQTARVVREYGKRLATHAGESASYREISIARTGKSDVDRIVEFLHPDFVVHMTAGTPDEFDTLAAAGIPVVMCPRTQAALGLGTPPLLTALDRGVTVALGSDNAMMSSPDVLQELQYFFRALRAQAGDPARPTVQEMVATVTTAAARVLGLEDRLGWLDIGREATFFLLDMNTANLRHVEDPLVALATRATSADIKAVVVAGEIAYGALEPGN